MVQPNKGDYIEIHSEMYDVMVIVRAVYGNRIYFEPTNGDVDYADEVDYLRTKDLESDSIHYVGSTERH